MNLRNQSQEPSVKGGKTILWANILLMTFALVLFMAFFVQHLTSDRNQTSATESALSFIDVQLAPHGSQIPATTMQVGYSDTNDGWALRTVASKTRTTNQQGSNNQAKQTCRDCGTIQSVQEIKQKGESSAVGIVGGGVVGGVLGNQVGKGRGRTIMTVVGAVGGAVAGSEIEKSVQTKTVYEVHVRMDDGSTYSATYDQRPAFRQGDRVFIDQNGAIAYR